MLSDEVSKVPGSLFQGLPFSSKLFQLFVLWEFCAKFRQLKANCQLVQTVAIIFDVNSFRNHSKWLFSEKSDNLCSSEKKGPEKSKKRLQAFFNPMGSAAFVKWKHALK